MAIEIREFGQGGGNREEQARLDSESFLRLNEEWIRHYFVLEPQDLVQLRDPERALLAGGGRILFAVEQEQRVGCVGLESMPGPVGDEDPARGGTQGEPGGEVVYDLVKMAVTPTCQGRGLGRRLLQAAIALARSLGATRLTLETNSGLQAAIALYTSAGFTRLPPERLHGSPYARADVFMELDLKLDPKLDLKLDWEPGRLQP